MNPATYMYFPLECLEYALWPVWKFFFGDSIGDKWYTIKYSLSANKMINHISRDFWGIYLILPIAILGGTC